MTVFPLCKPVLSLDQLTVVGVRPAEFVEIAAAAGYGAISPFIGIGDSGGLPTVPLRAQDPDTLAMARALTATGVFINNADGFALFDASPMPDLYAGMMLMREMGARGIVTLQFDGDANRGFDRFCQLGAWAKELGLNLVLEFTPLSQIASLGDAIAYVERTHNEACGVLVDLLHLNQSGGSPAEVAAAPTGIIRGAQLCDGPAAPSFEQYAYNALYERRVPGDGELPTADFVASLPPDVILGLEVPLRSLEALGESHLQRARRLMLATQRILGAR